MESILAWGHYLTGITWIGILYYFNFIQVPFLKVVKPETKAEAFQHLVPNALWWFRHRVRVGNNRFQARGSKRDDYREVEFW